MDYDDVTLEGSSFPSPKTVIHFPPTDHHPSISSADENHGPILPLREVKHASMLRFFPGDGGGDDGLYLFLGGAAADGIAERNL